MEPSQAFRFIFIIFDFYLKCMPTWKMESATHQTFNWVRVDRYRLESIPPKQKETGDGILRYDFFCFHFFFIRRIYITGLIQFLTNIYHINFISRLPKLIVILNYQLHKAALSISMDQIVKKLDLIISMVVTVFIQVKFCVADQKYEMTF